MTPEIIALGVAFYDALRSDGYADYDVRHAAVCYMRRKDPDCEWDSLPFYEALADALAKRAAARIQGVEK